MENQKPVRLIDELGRLVLPIEARKVMEWGEKTPVEIWVSPTNDEIVLRRHIFACNYCGSTESLKEYQKRYICPDCQAEISKL